MPWPNLPLEIFEAILAYLSQETIHSLRLVNRSFNASCFGPRFQDLLDHLSTGLSEDSLRALDRLPKQTLHTLTIRATCFDMSKGKERMFTKVCGVLDRLSPAKRRAIKYDRDLLEHQRNVCFCCFPDLLTTGRDR